MPVETRSHNKTRNSISTATSISSKESNNNSLLKELNPSYNKNEKCMNCWGMWGHRSSVDKVYWRDGINYGYRSENKSWSQTFLTLFSMHNETMNIWTHLIGFSFTFCAILYYFIDKDILFSYAYPFIFNVTNDFKFNDDFITHSPYGPVYFFSFIISASICLLLSSIYHWFSCMSPQHHDNLLYLDVTGVALLVGSSYFPAIYLGFYCFETLQTAYLCLSFAVLVIGLVSTWVEIKIFNHSLRTFVFAGMFIPLHLYLSI